MVHRRDDQGLFCHPLSKAVLCSAWEQGVRTVTLPQPLRDGFWMQRGDNISCSFLVFIAFPLPRWQGHCTRLGCHKENVHRDALSAEGNETPVTHCKPEQVPDRRRAAGMLVSELQHRPSHWSTNTLVSSKDY